MAKVATGREGGRLIRTTKREIAFAFVAAISGWFYMEMNILCWPYSFVGLVIITGIYLLYILKSRRPDEVKRILLYACGAVLASWWAALPFIFIIYLLECDKDANKAIFIVATFIIIVSGTIFCFLNSDWYPTAKDKFNFFRGWIAFAITVGTALYLVIK